MGERHYRKLIVNAIKPKIFINGRRASPRRNDHGKFQGARSASMQPIEICDCGLPKSQIHEKLGCEHYGKMREHLNNGHTREELELFDLLEPRMSISSIEFRKMNKEGVLVPGNKCDSGVVYLYLAIDAGEENYPNTTRAAYPASFTNYQVTIHELWHSIDYFMGNNIGKKDNITHRYEKNKLYKTIIQDIDDHIDFIIRNDKEYNIQKCIRVNSDKVCDPRSCFGGSDINCERIMKCISDSLKSCNPSCPKRQFRQCNHYQKEQFLKNQREKFQEYVKDTKKYPNKKAAARQVLYDGLDTLYDHNSIPVFISGKGPFLGRSRILTYIYDIIYGEITVRKSRVYPKNLNKTRDSDKKYWGKRVLAAEFFANVSCISGVVGDGKDDALMLMNAYFPKSYIVYSDIIKHSLEILKK